MACRNLAIPGLLQASQTVRIDKFAEMVRFTNTAKFADSSILCQLVLIIGIPELQLGYNSGMPTRFSPAIIIIHNHAVLHVQKPGQFTSAEPWHVVNHVEIDRRWKPLLIISRVGSGRCRDVVTK